jgi:GDP-L-fucose synthase
MTIITCRTILPALIRKFHEAKLNDTQEVVIGGSVTPRREFLYVDDLADASLFLMMEYNGNETVNVGTGKDIPIIELAHLIAEIVGFNGKITKDPTKPDGTLRELLDVSKLH